MKYFRLIEKIHYKTPLGYSKAGGRWNMNGTPMVYASNISAINFLELLSIKGTIVANTKWTMVTMEIEGDIPYLTPEDLPKGWNIRPYPMSTQQFGTNWSQRMMSLCLKVPSCRLPISRYPEEHNLLINPVHQDLGNLVKVISIEDVEFEVNKWK